MAEKKEFSWKIENFNLYSGGSNVGGKILRSPEITVGSPHHSNWYLEVHNSILKRHFNCILKSTNGSFDGSGTCAITVVCPECKNPEFWDANSPIYHSTFMIQECCLTEGTLTLKCRLKIYNATFQHIASVTDFSQIISNLYEGKNFSDIILQTNDKEFFLHKFLLIKRAPKLFEELSLDGGFKDGRVKIETISTLVLEMLVQYLYSGKLGTISEECLLEFYEVIKKYKFESFNSEYFHLESFSSICTRINVDRRVISLNRKPISDNSPFFNYRIHFNFACFLIKAWFERYPLKCMKISIQCVSALKEGIVLHFSLSLGKDKSSALVETSKKLLFLNERKPSIISVNFPQKNSTYKNCSGGKLSLEVSTGEYVNHSVSGSEMITTERPSIFGMGLLRHDISSLFYEAQTKNGNNDVTLCFEGIDENVLFAHKAILAAWSPVFASMFDHDMLEKESDEVKIPDISFKTGKRLLWFMYSGEITKSTCAEDMEIYAAADKYQISSLFRQCSVFLSTHLTVNSACDILVVADQHSDECLLAQVQECIGSNRSEILGSSIFLSLIDINPRLVSKVLRCVSLDLQRV